MSPILGISCFALGISICNLLWMIQYQKFQEKLQNVLNESRYWMIRYKKTQEELQDVFMYEN